MKWRKDFWCWREGGQWHTVTFADVQQAELLCWPLIWSDYRDDSTDGLVNYHRDMIRLHRALRQIAKRMSIHLRHGDQLAKASAYPTAPPAWFTKARKAR